MAPRRPSPLLALACLALLVAGCTGSTPIAQNGPLRVDLVGPPTLAAPGQSITLQWRAVGGRDGVTHSELHFGPESQPDAGTASYARVVPGQVVGFDSYEATIPAPSSGVLFARGHVRAGGLDLWSAEARIDIRPGAPGNPSPAPATPTTTGVEFTNVRAASAAEAGTAFLLTFHLDGTGTTAHAGAHFSRERSPAQPTHFEPAAWPGQRASEHVGGREPLNLPTDVTVGVVLPTPGQWSLRPHVVVDGVDYWGAPREVEAVDPAQPNVILLDPAPAAVAGSPAAIRFAVNAQPGTPGLVSLHASANSSARLLPGFTAEEWTGQVDAGNSSAQLPGVFSMNFTPPAAGAWYYRAHARIGGEDVWSGEAILEAKPPG